MDMNKCFKRSESREDYLETIKILFDRNGFVRSIDIAEEMNFSKPSVSIAMKKLKDEDYINIDDKGHIVLTDKGQKIADETYERHQILFAVFKKLGVNDETALEDACRVEHDLSEETFSLIKEHYLKNNK